MRQCRSCGPKGQLQCVSTARYNRGRITKRWRTCLRCGRQYQTVELQITMLLLDFIETVLGIRLTRDF